MRLTALRVAILPSFRGWCDALNRSFTVTDEPRKGFLNGLLGRLLGDSNTSAGIPTPKNEGQSLRIFEGRTIFVPTPASWVYRVEGGPLSVVPTFSVTHSSNEVRVMVSAFPDAARKLDSLEAIEHLVITSWELLPDRQSALEKVLRIQKVSDGNGKTVWHKYTDGSLVGQPIPPNQWLHVTKGIRAWDGLFLQFTVLSNSLESAEYLLGRDIALGGIRELPAADRA